MNNKWSSFFTYGVKYFLNCFKTRFEVAAIDCAHLNAMESFRIFRNILSARFLRVGRDVPFVVLYQINDGKLFQCRHLKSLGHFSFCTRSVPQRTNDNWCVVQVPFSDSGFFFVLNSHGDSGSWNCLHSGS